MMQRLFDWVKGTSRDNGKPQAAAWTPLNPRASSWYRENFNGTAVPVNADTALNSGTAMACTRAISETLASLPALIIEQVSQDERRKARENPMWALLHDQPNPDMDAMTWYQINATRVVNRGNAVNLIEFNGRGVPIALWPVHGSRFEIFRMRSQQLDNGRFFPGDIFYRIWPDETQRHFDVPRNEILNIVSWDTDDGLIGRSVVQRAKLEIGLETSQQEFSGSMFKNGALPLGLIKHPWMDDKEQRENLRADINSLHSGRENWNKIGILWDKDADWVKLNFSPEDVQAIQSRVFSAKALCRYYGVPPSIVQIFDDFKFATVEAMLKHFIMLTIRPYAIRFERAINSQILRSLDPSIFLEFALEALLRGDPETQAKTNVLYRNAGVIQADEIRQRDLNMNPLPDELGQVILAPLNQAPLELIAEGANMRGGSSGGDTGNTEANSRTGENPELREFAQTVLERTLHRMIENEVNAMRGRACRGPAGFFTWLDQYYNKFHPRLAEALQMACEGLSDKPGEMAGDLARWHCAESRRQLLNACECQPEAFEQSIVACVETWRDRQPVFEEVAA